MANIKVPYPAVIRGRNQINFDTLNQGSPRTDYVIPLFTESKKDKVAELNINELILAPIYIRLLDVVSSAVNIYLGTLEDRDGYAAFTARPTDPYPIQFDADTPSSLLVNNRILLAKPVRAKTDIYLSITISGTPTSKLNGYIFFSTLRVQL